MMPTDSLAGLSRMSETVTVPTMWLWLALPPFLLGMVSLWLYVTQPFLAACERIVTKGVAKWLSFWEGVA
jgi:hypothetical protein